MSRFKIAWAYAWSVVALPFLGGALLCALVGAGPKAAREWGADMGIPFFRRL